jgi:hypothetical protein
MILGESPPVRHVVRKNPRQWWGFFVGSHTHYFFENSISPFFTSDLTVTPLLNSPPNILMEKEL